MSIFAIVTFCVRMLIELLKNVVQYICIYIATIVRVIVILFCPVSQMTRTMILIKETVFCKNILEDSRLIFISKRVT